MVERLKRLVARTSRVTITKVAISFVAAAVALTHVLWPSLAIDAITISLLGIAIVPWLTGIIKSIEFASVKAELTQNTTVSVEAELADAALLSPTIVPQIMFPAEAQAALSKLIREIDDRVSSLESMNREVLDDNQREALKRVKALQAVLPQKSDQKLREWVQGVGPSILGALDDAKRRAADK